MLGFHMPNSFRAPIWNTIRCLHLGFELYKHIFTKPLRSSRLYHGKPSDAKVFQYLIDTTSLCKTKSLLLGQLVGTRWVFIDRSVLLYIKLGIFKLIIFYVNIC